MGNYIGREPLNGLLTKQIISHDSSTTTFALDFGIASASSIIVSVNAVILQPDVGYTISGGGTNIVFASAPSATTYIHYLGQSIVTNLVDVNGVEFILDADADTSLTADTDDEIDIKIGGVDRSTIKSTGFHNIDSYKFVAGTSDDMQLYHDGTNSYLTNAVGALKIATETSGIAVTIGHTTSEVTVADNLTVTGTLTVGGTVNFGDFDISNVGSIALDTITNDGTDITLDSSDDIVIDAAGGNIEFKDAGTLQLTLDMDGTAGAQVIQLGVDGDDLLFKQYDGTIVLTLDDNTNVTVAADLTVGDDLFVSGGVIDLKNTGTASQMLFYCESSNAHAQTIQAAPHSQAASNTLLLPDGGNGTLVSTVSTATLTNKTLTTPVIAEIDSGADITLDATADVVIDAAGGNVEFKDAGTLQLTLDMDGTAGVQIIKLGVDADDLVFQQYDGNEVIRINDDRKLYFFDDGGENIFSDGTDFTFASGNDINLTATTDINVPSGVGMTFGNDGEKIEGDGTDLTIASSAALNLTATTDVVIPANVGITFGTGEKIEGDSTDLTITSGAKINLTATSDIVVPANVGITFGTGEKIEGDSTDLTITSGAKINLTATSDIIIPNDVGIQFGGASEKIEGDGTDLVISANNLTVDAAADIILDAAGNDILFKSGGTHVLSITNSSSDVIIKPIVDAKDLIFQQRDGTEVARIEDNATFNVSSAGKFAYAGTAVTATAAELNLSDLATLGTSAASKVLSTDANNFTIISGGVGFVEDTLSFDATQDWDVRASPIAKVTLTANVTFDAPTNPTTGQYIAILCIQDGTGSRTIAWNAVFEFALDTTPTATTTANLGDLFTFRYNGAKWLEVGRNLALTLS